MEELKNKIKTTFNKFTFAIISTFINWDNLLKLCKDHFSEEINTIKNNQIDVLNKQLNDLKEQNSINLITNSNKDDLIEGYEIQFKKLVANNELLSKKLEDEITNHSLTLAQNHMTHRLRNELGNTCPTKNVIEEELEYKRVNKVQCHIVKESLNS